MNRFLGQRVRGLEPYIPGEQPQERKYIKLNTNESPYPPAPGVRQVLQNPDTAADLRLYPDPEGMALRAALAARTGLAPEQIFAGNGSDEVLAFAFLAFFDAGDPVYFADMTYGFYKIYAQLCGLNAKTVPLQEDYTLAPADYEGLDGHMFIANPNAPTGMALDRTEIERVLRANPDRLVVVDEAYADFADASVTALPLVDRYDNLLVVRTFSKSSALAGLRVGWAAGNASLIDGLNRIKDSFNPYNLCRLSIAAATAAVRDEAYLQDTVAKVVRTRERTRAALLEQGCEVLPSSTNFLFVRGPGMDGAALYEYLRENGVLVRHFTGARTQGFVRVSIGTDEDMDRLLALTAQAGDIIQQIKA